MSMVDMFTDELASEAATTRRVLERVPADRLDWRPHRKSFSLGQLALHIASIPPGVSRMALADEMEVPKFQQAAPASHAEIMDTFDRGIEEAKANLAQLDDRKLQEPWRVMRDGEAVMTVPRAGLIRAILLNQIYHHRGQLTVYLRQLDVPLPPVYGPTADESPF